MNNRIKVLCFVFTAAACWASCKKGDDAPAVVVTTKPAAISVFNLSANNVNIYANGTRLNNTTTYYPGGTLGYFLVESVAKNYAFKIDRIATVFYEKSIRFTPDSIYSVYVASPKAEDVFMSEDFLIPDTGINLAKYAQVRYVNASPNAGNFKFVLRGASSLIADSPQVDNIAYKITTEFKQVKAGLHYIGVYRAGYPTAPKIDTVTLSAGKIYTFYGYGNVASGGNLGIFTGLFANL
jgi:hypothetical protein